MDIIKRIENGTTTYKDANLVKGLILLLLVLLFLLGSLLWNTLIQLFT